MPTLAQLQAEPWWGREIVTVELDWAANELCRRTGRPRVAAGTKGNEAHLRGSHRSQEWILSSRYCTNRTYTVQAGLTATQARHIAGLDFVPGVWGTAANRRLMVEQTGRLMAEMRAGRLEGVRELYGTLDGRAVTGWNNVTNRYATSDITHLDHWHLGIDRRRLTDRALMERIVAVALGEDDLSMTPEEYANLINNTPMSSPSPNLPFKTLGDWLKGGRAADASVNALAVKVEAKFAEVSTRLAAIEAKLADPVDEAALAAELAARLQPLAPGATVEQVAALLSGLRLRAEPAT